MKTLALRNIYLSVTISLKPKYINGIAISVLLLALTFVGCNNNNNHSDVPENAPKEGHIEFDVTYPYLDSNDIGLNLLPHKMDLHFKDNKYRVESVGGMGLFAMGYVSDNDIQHLDYFLKIISNKMASRFNSKGIKKLNREFPAFQMKEIDSTRVIAGYKCRGHKIIYYSNVVDDHIIWETNELDLTNSNWFTPFPKIKGVMLAYQVQRNGLVVNFEASKVHTDTIDPNIFKIPLEYKIIPNRELIRKMEEAFIGFEY